MMTYFQLSYHIKQIKKERMFLPQISSPGEGCRSSVLCGGEVWCRALLFPAFRSRSGWGNLQSGLGDQMRDSSGTVLCPRPKTSIGHLLYNCFMVSQQGLLLYPNPTDLNWERSQLILPALQLGSLTLFFCFAQIEHCTLSNLFWAMCVSVSQFRKGQQDSSPGTIVFQGSHSSANTWLHNCVYKVFLIQPRLCCVPHALLACCCF